MSAAASTPAIPDGGRLSETPLPRLLLDLQRAKLSGSLTLRQAQVEKRIQLREGALGMVESNRPSESLISLLAERGKIDTEQRETATQMMRARQCKELAALLALKVLGPRDLFMALRDQAKQSLIECFGWPGGEFELSLAVAPARESQPLQIDLLALAQEGIATHWRPHRILTALGDRVSQYPKPTPLFLDARKSLIEDEPLCALLDSMDGTLTTWAALQRANSKGAFAAFWVLDAIGALEYAAEGQPADGEDTPDQAQAQGELEIEISVPEDAEASPSAIAESAAHTATSEATATEDGDSALAALRDEVREKHARLRELNFYQLLGVEREATPAQIKRAYIKAAKRLHPDALSHLGLEELKHEANEVFAEIAKAHTTLLDEQQRQGYNASLDGHSAVDANQVAQAEALYRKGEILLRAGNFAGALDFLEAAARLWPEESDYQSAYGWALHRKNPPESERAREHLEKAIALEGDNSEAHQRLGLVLKALGEETAAEEALTRSRKLARARS
jgi:tetratricopeptide (TPR) repeat protein